jgi:hypothetical protein
MGQGMSREKSTLGNRAEGGRQIFIGQRARYRKNDIGDFGTKQLKESGRATQVFTRPSFLSWS